MTGLEYMLNLSNYEEQLLLLFIIVAFCVEYKFNFRQPLNTYVRVILSASASYIIVKITVIPTELIIINIYKLSGKGIASNGEFTWGTTILCIILLYGIGGILIYLISKLTDRVSNKYKSGIRNYYFVLILLVIIAVSIYAVDEAFRVSNVSFKFLWIVLVIMAIMLVISTFAVWMFANATIKEQKVRSEQENRHNLELYMKTLESNYNEVRKFRHDIKNAISALNYRINEFGNKELIDDVNNMLKQYNFNAMSDQKLYGFNNIKNPFIKGLIFSKYLEAQSKDIKFNVEISKDVLNDKEKYSDEFRILGILLDNALEAAENSAEPVVTVGVESSDSYHNFLVVNTIKNPNDINLSEISKRGYSSKGEGRGLGLSTVREITNKNSDMYTSFKIDDGKFIANLTLNKG